MATIGRLLIVLVVILIILFYFRNDSIWFYEPPGAGSASFKMQGTVPPKTPANFGGFYKGFPSKSENIRASDDW